MLLFSTVLAINDTLTHDKFIELVIEWNQKSLHTENIIPNLVWSGERNIRFGDDGLWMDIQEYRNENIIAVRCEKIVEDGVIWDTDYVMNFDEMKMCIQLDRSFKEEALVLDEKFSTPHFISMLIDKGYLKDDKILPVLNTPTIIKESNMNILTDVINGTEKYELPVVYVSKNHFNSDPVDIWWLAKRLKGVAHVFIQSHRKLNGMCREMCNDKNEFNLQNYNSNEQNKNEMNIAIYLLSQQFKEYGKLMNMFVDNNTYEKQTQEDLLNAYLGVGLSTQTGTRFSMPIDLKNFSDNPSQAIKEFLEKTDTTDLIQILDAIKDKTSYTKL